jgi:hypothetical protein
VVTPVSGAWSCAEQTTTCLQDFAAGWILASDLCGWCTRLFMTALDAGTAEPLTWHPKYVSRAKEGE